MSNDATPRSLGAGDDRGISVGLKDSQVGFFGECAKQQELTFSQVAANPQGVGGSNPTLTTTTFTKTSAGITPATANTAVLSGWSTGYTAPTAPTSATLAATQNAAPIATYTHADISGTTYNTAAITYINTLSSNVSALITGYGKLRADLSDVRTKYANLLGAVSGLVTALNKDHADLALLKTSHDTKIKIDIHSLWTEAKLVAADIGTIQTKLGQIKTDLTALKNAIGTTSADTLNANFTKIKTLLKRYGFVK